MPTSSFGFIFVLDIVKTPGAAFGFSFFDFLICALPGKFLHITLYRLFIKCYTLHIIVRLLAFVNGSFGFVLAFDISKTYGAFGLSLFAFVFVLVDRGHQSPRAKCLRSVLDKIFPLLMSLLLVNLFKLISAAAEKSNELLQGIVDVNVTGMYNLSLNEIELTYHKVDFTRTIKINNRPHCIEVLVAHCSYMPTANVLPQLVL